MIMYAINALYFKANWKYEFKPEDTKELPFYDERGTSKNVAMMSMEQILNTYRNETFTSVVGIEYISVGGSNSIVFNKPFLYVITNKETGAICFMGKVGNPEYK